MATDQNGDWDGNLQSVQNLMSLSQVCHCVSINCVSIFDTFLILRNDEKFTSGFTFLFIHFIFNLFLVHKLCFNLLS